MATKDELLKRRAALSPAQRALLDQHIKQRLQAEQPTPLLIPKRVPAAPRQLSFAQERFWFLQYLEPDSVVYNEPDALALRGPVDRGALTRAVREIVRRHEVLRSTFPLVDATVQWVVHPTAHEAVTVPVIDLSALPEAERAREVRQRIADETRRPFHLTTELPWRISLLHLAPTEQILLLTFHHIVHDGWSGSIFLQEMLSLYAAYVAERPSPLPELAIQYADYAAWQRQWLQSAAFERHLAYWKHQLAGAPPVLALPTDRPRPPIQSFRGERYAVALDAPLHAALQAFSQQGGGTLFMTLLAVFTTLLARYSGQEDVVVGSPIAGRTRPELEGLLGCFVNTLVLRTELRDQPPFATLAQRVRQVCLAAYEHQELPFEHLVEVLQHERDPSQTPLVQVMFQLQNVPEVAAVVAEVEIAPLPIGNQTAKFDLSLRLHEGAAGLYGFIEYSTDLFDRATIARLWTHFLNLAAAAMADPTWRVSELPLLGDDERHQLLHAWNATEADYGFPPLVQHFFEQHAARTPAACAACFATDTGVLATLSYAALNARANQLAHCLQQLGVGPDTPVALLLPRSLDLVIALLAVLKAGGCYLPLDPDYPAERLQFMLADAAAPVIVTHAALPAAPAIHTARILYLDRDHDRLDQQPSTPPRCRALPANLAYIIYTSGSTGQPKGVAMPHRALSNLLHWQLRHTTIHEPVRTLQFAPISFDVSLQEIFTAWGSGGTLVLLPEALRRDTPALLHLLRDQQVARLFLPFVALQQLAEVALTLDRLPSSLREVITAGEQLQTTPPVVAFFARLPQCILHNQYGPSETHIVTEYTLDDSPDTWTALPPIGRPIANTQMYLLDRHGQPVPLGVVGELYIGGANVARGYLHRPALTAERFVPDSFSATPGARLYWTGDLARYLPDGALQFLGRRDQQLKLRGYRIELGEIESVLAQHPTVQAVVVVPHSRMLPDGLTRDTRLIAYVVLHPDQTESGDDILAFLQGKLPDYMLPRGCVLLEALPRTPSGKIDRRALPNPDDVLHAPTRYVAPRTPTEELIAGVWATVLGVARVGVHDNFFTLGGHSLLATQVVTRLRHLLAADVPLRLLFDAPTIAALAAQLAAPAPDAALPLRPAPRDGAPLPLSFAQQRLWFLDQLQPGSAAYAFPFVVRLRGPLQGAALQQSLQALVARHEVLRTTFAFDPAVDPPMPVQRIAPPAPVPLPLVALPPHADAAAVQDALADEIARPFDLQQGPLLRATLFQPGDDTHILVLVLHHSIFDGWSIDLLLRELTTWYVGLVQHAPPSLPPLPIQYADYSVWQRQWLQGATLDAQLAYWTQQLAGLPPLDLPTDSPRPARLSDQGRVHAFHLPATLSDALQRLSQQLGSTLFMTLLTAFHTLLARWSGQADFAIGTPIAGRVRPELEELIGFFVNTLVLRTDLRDQPPFAEAVARVRRTCLAAYSHQDVPFEVVVDAMQPERDPSRTPLFQVMFTLQNQRRAPITLPELVLEPVAVERRAAKFDLTLLLDETAEGLVGEVEYRSELFTAATIGRLVAQFTTLLAGIVADPHQRLDRLPLLTAAERRQLLVDWNATTAPYPHTQCLHQLFEAQATRTPDAVAIVCGDHALTYAELNRRANHLAQYLHVQGVGPDVLVALCVERSLDFVVAALGVVKAGGAYVPIDPAYPAEHLQFILDDSQAAVLLTQEAIRTGLPPHRGLVVCLDAEWPLIERLPATAPVTTVQPEHLAYVIYTSGSTGRPKGTLLTHRGLVNYLCWRQHTWPLTSQDRLLHTFSFSFDPSVGNLFWPLLAGAQVVLTRAEEQHDSRALVRLLQTHRITITASTPSLYQMLLDEPALAECHSLRHVVSGGEALSLALQQRLFAHLHADAELVNVYGPTEATIETTTWVCSRKATTEIVPIGRPMTNAQVYALDGQMQPVPVGVVGELYIGGDGLARGYLNRPDLTAEKFIPDPFSQQHGRRFYKTGDLARFLPDGNIEFLGRVDQQVKIRGFRIELGEIEAVLRQHEAVREALVTVRSSGDRRYLAAYVVEIENSQATGLTAHDLRQFLAQRLPSYMIPTAFVLLATLPLTANGKLDRKALPDPEAADHTDPPAQAVEPRTPVEAVLELIWRHVLGLAQISVHANFFDVRGDSLLAMQVFARLKEIFPLDLPIQLLFEAPTIATLADRLVEIGAAQQLDIDRMAQLFIQLDQLSDDEVARVLAEQPDDA